MFMQAMEPGSEMKVGVGKAFTVTVQVPDETVGVVLHVLSFA